jgi:hypothetical protein
MIPLITLVLCSFWQLTAYAESSTDIVPISHIISKPAYSYVLVTDKNTSYCGGGNGNYFGCDFEASTKKCLPGFQPKLTLSTYDNNYAGVCALREIILSPTLYESGNTYRIKFTNAFANFVSCANRNVSYYYTVTCVPD